MVQEKPDTFFCTKCGRVLLYPSSQSANWIISSDGMVVRCPQHITDWAMRCAKVRRTKANYLWRELAKGSDTAPQDIMFDPFFDL
jgi:predicted RNA-binding Zn-ribbon protein involved in translation (DUF1610 family)